MTPERLAEIRLIGEDIGWVAELLAALDACERLRAAAEADADHWKAIAAARAAYAAAVALRPPVMP